MAKVYCNECRYFRAYNHSVHHKEECTYPENMVEIEAPDTYRRRAFTFQGQAREPWKINANNDCSWFEAEDFAGDMEKAMRKDSTDGPVAPNDGWKVEE